MSNLRDAVLVAPAHGEDGYDQAKKTLEERRKRPVKHREVLPHCARVIGPPEVVEAAIMAVVAKAFPKCRQA